jgi:hypothetical protein
MGARKIGRQDKYFQYSEMYATMIGMQEMNVTEIPVLTRWLWRTERKAPRFPSLSRPKRAREFSSSELRP